MQDSEKKWGDRLRQSEVVRKLTSDIVAKLLFMALVAAATIFVSLMFQRNHEPVFLHKTWVSEDGSVVMHAITLESIEITGRPEGTLLFRVIEHAPNSNRYAGDLICADHGGVIGQLVLDLEPFNQIHLRTTSTTSGDYEVDVKLRVNWPKDKRGEEIVGAIHPSAWFCN